MIFRNSVLKLQNIQIWYVPNWKGFYLLFVRFGIFRPRNVPFEPCHHAKGGFHDAQESRFQASKRSNMGSVVLVIGRCADIQEFCFEAAKRSDMDCAELQGGLFLIVRNGILKLRNVQIRAGPSCKRVHLLMLRLRIVQQCVVLS